MEAMRISKIPLVLSERNDYGALISPVMRGKETPAEYRGRTVGMQDTITAGLALVALAVRSGKLAAETCEFDGKGRGFARNYDLYDVAPAGSAVVVQERETTGTKYGLSPRKTYWIVRKRGKGVTVEACPMPGMVVKVAKASTALGQVLAVVTGRRPARSVMPSPTAPETVYKAVAVTTQGYRSVFDGCTDYAPGTTLEQAARGGHGGGYYAYRTVEEAKKASVPTASALGDNVRAIVRCVGSGARRAYGNGKRAYSRLEVVDVVALRASRLSTFESYYAPHEDEGTDAIRRDYAARNALTWVHPETGAIV